MGLDTPPEDAHDQPYKSPAELTIKGRSQKRKVSEYLVDGAGTSTAAKSPWPSPPCANCLSSHHTLATCRLTKEPTLRGCPRCNTRDHNLDDCPHLGSLTDSEIITLLIKNRSNSAMIHTTIDWIDYFQRYSDDVHLWQGMGFPHTLSFAKGILLRARHFINTPQFQYGMACRGDPATLNYHVIKRALRRNRNSFRGETHVLIGARKKAKIQPPSIHSDWGSEPEREQENDWDREDRGSDRELEADHERRGRDSDLDMKDSPVSEARDMDTDRLSESPTQVEELQRELKRSHYDFGEMKARLQRELQKAAMDLADSRRACSYAERRRESIQAAEAGTQRKLSQVLKDMAAESEYRRAERRDHASLQRDLDLKVKNAREDARRLKADLEHARAELQRAKQDAAPAIKNQLEQVKDNLEMARKQVTEMKEQAEANKKQMHILWTQVENGKKAAVELSQTKKQLGDAEKRLQESNEQAEKQAKKQIEEKRGDIEYIAKLGKQTGELKEARRQLEEAKKKIAELETRLEETKRASAGASDGTPAAGPAANTALTADLEAEVSRLKKALQELRERSERRIDRVLALADRASCESCGGS